MENRISLYKILVDRNPEAGAIRNVDIAAFYGKGFFHKIVQQGICPE